jgi:hypothetical protein
MRSRLEDALVLAGLVATAGLCVAFRYLPMTDLPQHWAMVSIIAHHDDPAYGFAGRFAFDFWGRPYATVYLLGAGLTRLVGLEAAMRVVVALCTIAPAAGLATLLRATGRPRLHALLAVPVAFGSVWHWGFLNFLLGTGLLLAGLALTIDLARRPRWPRALALGALGLVVLFTHVHVLLVLLGLAPAYAWAWRDEGTPAGRSLRAALPLAPAAVGAVAFALTTWSHASAAMPYVAPGFVERVRSFPDDLGAGLRSPWPAASLAALAAAGLLIWLLARGAGAPEPGRRRAVAIGACLAQVVLFFALPLGTSTVAFLSARHALLAVLFGIALLPAAAGRGRTVAAGLCLAVAAVALVVVGGHLWRFDREARAFDPILARMAPNRRVVALMPVRYSALTHPRTSSYLHFAAYYQARRGGDIGRSFAAIWNVPVRYRSDYRRHQMDVRVEFSPHWFSLTDDLPHFDYLILRTMAPARFNPELGLQTVAHSGQFTLVANPRAVSP